MKRWALVFLISFFVPTSSFAQTQTAVSGTVTDPNGIPYANGTYSVQLILPAGANPPPTVNGSQIQGAFNGGLDGTGSFGVSLWPNGSITPPSTTWQFTVCSNSGGIAPPLGTGTQCTPPTTITISGTAQVVGTTLSNLAPKLTNFASGGSVTSVTATSPIVSSGGATPAISCPSCTSTSNPAQAAANALLNLGISGPLFIGLPIAGEGATWADLSGAGNNIAFGGCGSGNPTQVTPIGLTFVSASSECLNAPTALNPAQTLIAVAAYTGNGGNYQAPIVGNGNGGSTGANGLIMGITAFSNTTASGYTPSALCNSTNSDLITTLVPVGAPVFSAVVFSTGNGDSIFYNDVNPLIMNTPGHCAAQSIGHYVVGGQAAGVGFGLRTYLDGTIYALAAFSGQATKAQAFGAYSILRDYLTKTGVPMNGQTTTSGNTVILVGDSQTQQPGGMYNFLGNTFAAQTNPPISLISMPAISGNFAASEITDYPYMVQGMVPVAGAGGMCVVNNWLGTVDIVTHAETAAQTWGYLSSILRGEAQSGCKVIATTVNSTTGFDSVVQALNLSIRQNWRANGAAFLNDLSSVQALGASGSSTNDPCFSDGIHKTVGCNDNIVGPLLYNAIESVTGCQDFSCATVYTSGASAAVATTSASQSGNTITFGFSATPANCQVGNWITINGVTPSGFNSTALNGVIPFGYWILTRGATSVTVYNDTTGLGTASGQGTASCPEQQAADNYTVYNCGSACAPTLLPCEGWTGQTKWFKNINATVTLTPYGAETIDGASTLTLATNSSIGLQSRLTSTTAAGCNLYSVN